MGLCLLGVVHDTTLVHYIAGKNRRRPGPGAFTLPHFMIKRFERVLAGIKPLLPEVAEKQHADVTQEQTERTRKTRSMRIKSASTLCFLL